jgi:hypothetical protein
MKNRSPITSSAGKAEPGKGYALAIQQVIDGSRPGTVVVIAMQGFPRMRTGAAT